MTRSRLASVLLLAASAVVVVLAVTVPTGKLHAMQDDKPKLTLVGASADEAGRPFRDKFKVSDKKFHVSFTVTLTNPPTIAAPHSDNFTYEPTRKIYFDGRPAAATVPGTGQNVEVPISVEHADLYLSFQLVETFTLTPGDGITDSPPLQYPPEVVRRSNRVVVMHDQKGPELVGIPHVVPTPNGGAVVELELDEWDIAPEATTLDPAKFETRRNRLAAYATETQDVADPASAAYDHDRHRIVLKYTLLDPGSYEMTVRDLVDAEANRTESTEVKFEVPGQRPRGRMVPYLPNLDEKHFSPAQRVDTRDVRLYYFRDAHRVAEIINRDVRSLNQNGYDAAQRIAAEARRDAEDAVDRRRHAEVLAVQAAQNVRQIQNAMRELRSQATQALDTVDRLETRREELDAAIEDIRTRDNITPFDTDPGEGDQGYLKKIQDLQAEQPDAEDIPEGDVLGDAVRFRPIPTPIATRRPNGRLKLRLASLVGASPAPDQAEIDQLLESLERIRELDLERKRDARELGRAQSLQNSFKKDMEELKTDLIAKEAAEVQTRNAVVDAEAKEMRSAKTQFRREVAAGLADRDTYVPGDPRSFDPVAQVSISVIGEGVLQLRGPMAGINKIRRMVHQIDAPVGQVKVGIHTVQINGEHGDRMEPVYEEIDKHVAMSRFMVNQSLLMFRKAVAKVAGSRAMRRGDYMHSFFGHDFIRELQLMESELLETNNKLLALHSMDNLSLAGALNVTALADNDARQEILAEFARMIQCELPQKEADYYRTLTRTRHRSKILNKLTGPHKQSMLDNRDARRLGANAARSYNFANLMGFFDSQIEGAGTMNNMQFATLRLAQTLKAQLIAERELMNLVKERSLLESRKGEIDDEYRLTQEESARLLKAAQLQLRGAETHASDWTERLIEEVEKAQKRVFLNQITADLSPKDRAEVERNFARFESVIKALTARITLGIEKRQVRPSVLQDAFAATGPDDTFRQAFTRLWDAAAAEVDVEFDELRQREKPVRGFFNLMVADVASGSHPEFTEEGIRDHLRRWTRDMYEYEQAHKRYLAAEEEAKKASDLYFSVRMLAQFIDEQEEKAVELLEALRSHSSNVDNYLKRLAIALEDDLYAQFYAPAFQKIRRVSRTYDVQLGQIESTTVVTNNRALGKVSPSATMEFDLPHRDILIKEAFEGSKALALEYGQLLKEPAFLAGSSILAGQPAGGMVNSQSPIQAIPGLRDRQPNQFGSALDSLIPEPSVYKFETGTGFEIRPVIQPDGHSIVYGFDYMYTTNVREPIRADEKHLGRVKRHFVHTDVQTSSYELREISRYTVALKAARTSRGVPLLEDVPVAGALFRPAPSDESSLQENIILADSVIYPTLYDLMGLRWSPYVDDVRSETLAQEKRSLKARQDLLRDHLRRKAQSVVDEHLGIEYPEVVTPGRQVPEPILPGYPTSSRTGMPPADPLLTPDHGFGSDRYESLGRGVPQMSTEPTFRPILGTESTFRPDLGGESHYEEPMSATSAVERAGNVRFKFGESQPASTKQVKQTDPPRRVGKLRAWWNARRSR